MEIITNIKMMMMLMMMMTASDKSNIIPMVNVYIVFWCAIVLAVSIRQSAVIFDHAIEYTDSTYGECCIKFDGRPIGTHQIRFMILQPTASLTRWLRLNATQWS